MGVKSWQPFGDLQDLWDKAAACPWTLQGAGWKEIQRARAPFFKICSDLRKTQMTAEEIKKPQHKIIDLHVQYAHGRKLHDNVL